MVKLWMNDDQAADVHFEAFQMNDICVKLFEEGWFDMDTVYGDPKISKKTMDVVVGGKDVKEVDNDFFLVPVESLITRGGLQYKEWLELFTIRFEALRIGMPIFLHKFADR
ncbi:hypothetical protein HPP92_013214 [Vanilla planifolia]|uniref:Uncharacterized protein n=1 Tax=Vanilla planifolia TaxID=51239 RepID=A0A835UZS9_VANPL|nr:hypothetical protein HPP92_013214 [Vanilla planifolia]